SPGPPEGGPPPGPAGQGTNGSRCPPKIETFPGPAGHDSGPPVTELGWVPGGTLAGFVGCIFEVLPAPGAGKAFENVGGEAP
ncbi:MAG: hypothetical protein WCH11_03220, partial [Bdellovibrio sp.]